MDILTGWQIPSDSSDEVISFDTGTVQEQVCIWRTDLPADPEMAHLQLQQSEEQLVAAEDALRDVPERIENLVKRAKAQGQGGLAFDTVALEPPEAELWRWLAVESGDGGVSYSLDYGLSQEWQNAREGFQRELARVLQLVVYYAWVETQVQGRLVVRSVLRWSGDMDTLWQGAVTPGQAGLHRRSLAVAVASRNLMLRTVLLTTQNAAKLATLLATPGGVVLALPAVWRFINQVLAELDQYKTMKNLA
jgi:hypothetical protein